MYYPANVILGEIVSVKYAKYEDVDKEQLKIDIEKIKESIEMIKALKET